MVCGSEDGARFGIHPVRKGLANGKYAAAGPQARFEDGDVLARFGELIRRGKSRQAGTGNDHFLTAASSLQTLVLGGDRRGAIGGERTRGGGHHALLQKRPAAECVSHRWLSCRLAKLKPKRNPAARNCRRAMSGTPRGRHRGPPHARNAGEPLSPAPLRMLTASRETPCRIGRSFRR